MRLNGHFHPNVENLVNSKSKVKRLVPISEIDVLQVLPEKGESLTSWLFRQSFAHYCQNYHQLFPEHVSVKGLRDPDLFSDLHQFVLRGNLFSALDLDQMTLKGEGSLWVSGLANRKFIPWLLPYSRNFGVQFCPNCWFKDQRSYYRLKWRFSLLFFCKECFCYMHHCCPNCGYNVKYKAPNFNDPTVEVLNALQFCWNCSANLSLIKTVKLSDDDLITAERIIRLLNGVESLPCSTVDYLIVLHFFTQRSYSNALRMKDYRYVIRKRDRSRFLEVDSKTRASLIAEAFSVFDTFPQIISKKPVEHLSSKSFWLRGFVDPVEWYTKHF